MPLRPAGDNAAADANVPLVPPAEPSSATGLSPGLADGHTVSRAAEGSATGFLFLGGVLAEGVEELAVSFLATIIGDACRLTLLIPSRDILTDLQVCVCCTEHGPILQQPFTLWP